MPQCRPLLVCVTAAILVLAIIGCKVHQAVKEMDKKLPVINPHPRATPLTNVPQFAVAPPGTNPPVKVIGNVAVWDWSIGRERITNFPIYVGGQKVEFDVEYATSLRQWKLLGRSFSNSFQPVPTNLTNAYFRVGVHTVKRK